MDHPPLDEITVARAFQFLKLNGTVLRLGSPSEFFFGVWKSGGSLAGPSPRVGILLPKPAGAARLLPDWAVNKDTSRSMVVVFENITVLITLAKKMAKRVLI